MKTKDSKGSTVFIGDKIKVLEIDRRITQYLPDDEKEELESFIGNEFVVEKINSDGSMLVTKKWSAPELGEVMGHELAIFPEGALMVGDRRKE